MSTPTPRTDTEITFTGAYTCTHHNDQQRAACPVCLINALTAERDQLRAALALGQLNCDNAYDDLRSERDQLRSENSNLRAGQKACEACDEPTAFEVRQLRARAEKAEAELVELHASFAGNVHAERDQLRAALTAERDQLRAEVANMHQTFAGNVHTDNRQLRAEVERYRLVTLKQDPELTAEREKAERYRLVTLRQHLAIERGRLDWLLSYDGVDWILSAHKNRKLFEGESDNRALLEAAMKEGAK